MLFLEKYLMVWHYVAHAIKIDPKAPLIHLYASKLTLKAPSMDTNIAHVLSARLKEFCNHPFTIEHVKTENLKFLSSFEPAQVLVGAKVALILDQSVCPDPLANLAKDLLENLTIEVFS
jgi:hypothetical protein